MKTETPNFECKVVVSYAYPSSPNAKRFGFANEGCRTVDLILRRNGVCVPPVSIAGFAANEIGEAQRHRDLAAELTPEAVLATAKSNCSKGDLATFRKFLKAIAA